MHVATPMLARQARHRFCFISTVRAAQLGTILTMLLLLPLSPQCHGTFLHCGMIIVLFCCASTGDTWRRAAPDQAAHRRGHASAACVAQRRSVPRYPGDRMTAERSQNTTVGLRSAADGVMMGNPCIQVYHVRMASCCNVADKASKDRRAPHPPQFPVTDRLTDLLHVFVPPRRTARLLAFQRV